VFALVDVGHRTGGGRGIRQDKEGKKVHHQGEGSVRWDSDRVLSQVKLWNVRARTGEIVLDQKGRGIKERGKKEGGDFSHFVSQKQQKRWGGNSQVSRVAVRRAG